MARRKPSGFSGLKYPPPPARRPPVDIHQPDENAFKYRKDKPFIRSVMFDWIVADLLLGSILHKVWKEIDDRSKKVGKAFRGNGISPSILVS
jgi:hypothetical protein